MPDEPTVALDRLASLGNTVTVSGTMDDTDEIVGDLFVEPMLTLPLEVVQRAARVLAHVARGRAGAFANNLYPDASARRALAEIDEACTKAGLSLSIFDNEG